MDIILLTKRTDKKGVLSLTRTHVMILLLSLLILLPAAILYTGFVLGQSHAAATPSQLQLAAEQQQLLHQQELAEAKREAQDSLNALAANVGRLQAHVMRLDALGERLTEMADMDGGEFDFSLKPAQGGPESTAAMRDVVVHDFINSLNELSLKLENRDHQLDVLEGLLMSHSLHEEVYPTGRPVKSGWLSSHFGERTDPFTGQLAQHEGVDFAGKEGSEVIAVAAGVVTIAERRYGYGNLVEVNHGNGFVTRYGHNKDILVLQGQTVKKGETLATMGSTGRSTGPHVHFEVLRNGKPVNPAKYIYSASK